MRRDPILSTPCSLQNKVSVPQVWKLMMQEKRSVAICSFPSRGKDFGAKDFGLKFTKLAHIKY